MNQGLPYNWGATKDEVFRRYPADRVIEGPSLTLTRAITIDAPTELAYRWICQLSVAPYSYDFVDNRGRRSPQRLTVGADDLHLGQRVMVFDLVDLETGRQWTGLTHPRAARVVGHTAVTYAVEEQDESSCRLVARLVVAAPSGRSRLFAYALAWGDLVMMRKQLLNLKRLAERDAIPARR